VIVLDTNVVSEAMRSVPATKVRRWLDRQNRLELWITTLTLAELNRGIVRLPPSRRRTGLAFALDHVRDELFQDRIVAFDDRAALDWGTVMTERQRAGRPIGLFDAMIAAIARVQGADLATRDAADFAGLGLRLIDPFENR
jgi:predicted nucleic acid-binding protein